MNPKNHLIIATRKSPLALVQTQLIQTHLQQIYPKLTIEILALSTEGDRKLDIPLATIGGKGLFVKELEKAILDGRADIAVHSTKDMPVELPKELMIAVFYQRDDPRDSFISNQYDALADLPPGATVGTSSLRRQCLIKHFRPDINTAVLRGNVGTRLTKLDAGEFTAIVLAAAGLQRLGLTYRIKSYFEPEKFTPAATQGIMCIECRVDDIAVQSLLKPLHDPVAGACAIAERTMNQHLQGGCQVPIGAFAEIKQEKIYLQGFVGNPAGTQLLRAAATMPKDHAVQLGIDVAEKLLAQGAADILERVYSER